MAGQTFVRDNMIPSGRPMTGSPAKFRKFSNSAAYSNNGASSITWDEGEGTQSDGPIGMILLSPLARGGGYFNSIYYTHSSFVGRCRKFRRVAVVGRRGQRHRFEVICSPSLPIQPPASPRKGAFSLSITGVVQADQFLEASTIC